MSLSFLRTAQFFFENCTKFFCITLTVAALKKVYSMSPSARRYFLGEVGFAFLRHVSLFLKAVCFFMKFFPDNLGNTPMITRLKKFYTILPFAAGYFELFGGHVGYASLFLLSCAIFGQPRQRKCPMNLSLSVYSTVHLQPKISELAHQFFLFFCMKSDSHKAKKKTKPDFLKKVPSGQEDPKTPKMGFLWF